jgi:hypothetical protein
MEIHIKGGKMRCIRRSKLIWDEEKQAAFYYRYYSGRRKNYSYRHTYFWELWEEIFIKSGITKEDIDKGIVWVEVYPGHIVRFIKKEGKEKK